MNFRVLRLAVAALLACGAVFAHAQGLRLPGGVSAPPAASAAGQRASDYIVAVVNSEPITNQQLRQEMQRTAQQMAQQGQPVANGPAFAAEVLERMILERVQIQLARESGIRIEEFMLDEAEQAIARQNKIDTKELYRRLEQDGFSRSQFRNQLRDQMLLSRVREREVAQKVRVSELEIDRYLQEQKRAAGNTAAELRMAHVLIPVPEGASEAQVAAAQAQAQQVVARAQRGEEFAALARSLSAAPDAADGGDLGVRPPDRFPPLFTQAVKDQPVGALAVVRSGAGFHVVKLIDRRSEGGLPTTVTQTRASHILLRPSPSLGEAAAVERLRAFRQRILAGQADFEALAREYSQDGSAQQGGDLGWATPGQFVPEFEAVLETLRPGEISEPLVSRFGVHLVKLVERRTARLGEREQRDAVRAILREQKTEDAYRSWASELRARAYVDMRQPPS